MLLKLIVAFNLILVCDAKRYGNYCDIHCHGGGSHTLCAVGYPPGGPKQNCRFWKGGITEEQKELILTFHNDKRQMVVSGEELTPRASNMMIFKWDNEAATIAQRWAEQCDQQDGHDGCRTLLSGEESGQNILIISFPAMDKINSLVRIKRNLYKVWYENQHTTLTDDLVKSYSKALSSGDTYIQMIWANTDRIGCGLSREEHGEKNDFKLVCNYVPKGLIYGEPIYKEGIACTACPEGSRCSRSWPGLCTRDSKDFDTRLDSGASDFKMHNFLLTLVGCFPFLVN